MNPTRGMQFLGCIALILLAATAGLNAAPAALTEADTLLKSATLDAAQAEKALSLYEELLSANAAPRPLVLARLARTCFILGQLTPKKYCEGHYRRGKVYADTLIHEDPNRVEGHYWLALNLCGLAENCGYMMARRLLPQIMQELERAVVLDATYEQAGAHRVLGRIYYEAPAWPMSVGDLHKSLKHLQTAVRLAPENSTNHLYLAQTLYRLHERVPAREELARVLKSTRHADKPQDLEEDKQKARRLLADRDQPGSPHLGSSP
ncbi:MAG: TRAP transporter TatT component family protein [Desulfobaccales bacterium]